ncbi:hypothetical protein [Nostoc sp. WHI]|uniref:hypothetical protein n=1 Tax=Nostoc sp. WHI TaxID=2650611 RepID=UPI0018C72562|nr:hypothetical protein [Nostoc sp. WHI]
MTLQGCPPAALYVVIAYLPSVFGLLSIAFCQHFTEVTKAIAFEQNSKIGQVLKT